MIASIAQVPPVHPFDARGIAKRFRHAAIFGALDALLPGETMRFVNDHDPLPLLAQLLQRYGDALAIQYRQREPGAIVIDFTVADAVAATAAEAEGEGCGCCGSCG
jgi:uncharacterized protein (DUF2249 family)